MKHLSHSQLWSLQQGELEPDARLELEAHLSLCVQCEARSQQVAESRALLSALPPVPEIPFELSQRVQRSLSLAEVAAPKLHWWSFDFSWRTATLTLACGAVAIAASTFLFRQRQDAPSSLPVITAILSRQETLEKTDTVNAEKTALPPAKTAPLYASVSKAKNARSAASADNATLKPNQQLAAGSTVKTESGGALWMKLPDGTRAGLTGSSEVTLKTLEASALALEVGQGSLALDVPHRTDRVLTVQAGPVLIRDLGTRFVVSKESEHVLVAVEEGSVEVVVDGKSETLQAGSAVEWNAGQLSRHPFKARTSTPVQTGSSPSPPPAAQSASLSQQPSSATQPSSAPQPAATADAEVAEDDETTEPGSDPSEWNSLPTQKSAAPQASGGSSPEPHAPSSGPLPGAFGLRSIEQRVNELARNIHMSTTIQRQDRAAGIVALGDRGDCHGVLVEADLFFRDAYAFREAYKASSLEKQLRRSVLFQKARCLTKLGRTEEAEAARQQMQSIR
jgi:hypothetical protein